MNNSNHPETNALPEIHINLTAMTLADKTSLAFLLLESMAADWKKAGVRTVSHTLPMVMAQEGDQIAVQCFDAPGHTCCGKPARRIPCLLPVELVDVEHIREILDQERRGEAGRDGVARLRALFKKEGDQQ